jgi:dTDP-4-dehydrorhamnose 3,5-epimerase
MTFTPTPLAGSFVIDLSPFKDGRGWFARTYCKNEFKQIGHEKEWVQLNHSATFMRGTVRGMHYQLPPYEEIKLVRCISGAVYDVIIDLREGSSTFLQWHASELSQQNKKMLYIPEGFAHGFQALTDDCELIYHHTQFYTPQAETGIRYNDPVVNIRWPIEVTEISEKDAQHPLLYINFKGI